MIVKPEGSEDPPLGGWIPPIGGRWEPTSCGGIDGGRKSSGEEETAGWYPRQSLAGRGFGVPGRVGVGTTSYPEFYGRAG